jgi:hypothetical protein
MKKARPIRLMALDKKRITKLTNLQMIRGGLGPDLITTPGKTTDQPRGGDSSRQCGKQVLDNGTSENCKSTRACS